MIPDRYTLAAIPAIVARTAPVSVYLVRDHVKMKKSLKSLDFSDLILHKFKIPERIFLQWKMVRGQFPVFSDEI